MRGGEMSAEPTAEIRTSAVYPQLLSVDCGNLTNQQLRCVGGVIFRSPQFVFSAVGFLACKLLISLRFRSSAVATPTGGYWSAALGCRSLLPRGAVGRADG